jgi:hypothetical protein
MDLIREIGEVVRQAREVRGADPDTAAAYFDRKAALLQRLAEDPTTADPDEILGMAATARAEARALREGRQPW